jgi:predicted metal-binding membrane protein
MRSPPQFLVGTSGAGWAALILSGLGWLGLGVMSLATEPGRLVCHFTDREFLGDAFAPAPPLEWTLMVFAMMGPLLAAPMDHLWHRSFARYRVRAIALFLMSYVVVWCLVCALYTLAIDAASRHQIDQAALLVALLPLAGIWQFSAFKQYAVQRCHLRPPISVFGVRAWLDPVWFALRLGFWCVSSCGALMLVAFVTPDAGMLAMLMASAIIFYERTRWARSRRLDFAIGSSRGGNVAPIRI